MGSLAAPLAARAGLALDRGELGAQLGDAVAHLAAVELARALAGAAAADAAALAVAAAARLAQARRHVARAARSPPGAAPRGCARGAGRSRGSRRVRSSTSAPVARSRLRAWEGERSWSTSTRLARGGAPSAAALRRARLRGLARPPPPPRPRALAPGAAARSAGPSGTMPLPPGPAGQLLQLALPDRRARRETRAPLGHAADDLDAEGLAEARELGEGRGELLVGDARKLDAEQDGAGRAPARRFQRASSACPAPRARSRPRTRRSRRRRRAGPRARARARGS